MECSNGTPREDHFYSPRAYLSGFSSGGEEFVTPRQGQQSSGSDGEFVTPRDCSDTDSQPKYMKARDYFQSKRDSKVHANQTPKSQFKTTTTSNDSDRDDCSISSEFFSPRDGGEDIPKAEPRDFDQSMPLYHQPSHTLSHPYFRQSQSSHTFYSDQSTQSHQHQQFRGQVQEKETIGVRGITRDRVVMEEKTIPSFSTGWTEVREDFEGEAGQEEEGDEPLEVYSGDGGDYREEYFEYSYDPPEEKREWEDEGEGEDTEAEGEDLTLIDDLFRFARHGRTDDIERLLDRGIPVDVREPSHLNTLLITACQNGSKRVAKAVLRRGADINARNNLGCTALHYCYHFGYGDTLGEYLISKGADPECRNTAGKVCWEGL